MMDPQDDWYWEVVSPYRVRHSKQIIDVEFEEVKCETKALIIYDFMTVQEAINVVENTDLYSVFMADDIVKGEVVVSHQDDDEHRWYIIATRVYKLEDGYVGVRGPYSSKSEMQLWEDIAADCGGIEVFEVEPVPSTYYKRK